MKLKFTLLSLFFALTGAVQAVPSVEETKAYLIKVEGYRKDVYYGSSREPYLVGIGHRLTKEEVASGRKSYTDAEIHSMFVRDYNLAVQACRRAFVSFDKHPKEVQLVLIDLAYSVGPTGLMGFVKMRSAIDDFCYQRAAHELVESRWATQVQISRVNRGKGALLAFIRS